MKVNINMTPKEVKEIMGEPDQVYSYVEYKTYKQKVIVYVYTPSVMASDGVMVIFDEETKKIIGKICNETDKKNTW